jgi:mannitol 2-dehydrogenase
MSVARTAKDDAMAWLKMEDIYGDVGSSEVFRKHFALMLEAIWSDGVKRVITRYIEGEI